MYIKPISKDLYCAAAAIVTNVVTKEDNLVDVVSSVSTLDRGQYAAEMRSAKH